MIQSFLAAWNFLTIIPVPGFSNTENPAALEKSAIYFPLVGLALGLLTAGFDIGVRTIFPPLVGSALVVIFLFALSGGMHMDGLADTADGFGSARSRERILEIMKDSRSGVMGILAVTSVFALKWGGIFELAPEHRFMILTLVPLFGRCNALMGMNLLPYARSRGLASVFMKKKSSLALWLSYAVAALGSFHFMKTEGLVIAVGALVLGLAFSRYSFRKIGGFTGDTLGAACELTEAFVLLIALALERGGMA